MMASWQQPRSAADWAARLRSDQVTAEDRAAYERWLHADPENRASARDLEQVWSSMDLLEDDPLVQAVLAAPPVHRRRRSWGLPTGVLRASVACLAVAAVSLSLWWLLAAGDSYRTANGEQRVVDLGDGSRLHLNVSTELDVSMQNDARRVTLVQGQAFFDVASDPSRPFVVTAGDKEITVLGTKFDVLLRGEDTRVTVIEGRVAVTSLGPAHSETLRVEPSQRPEASLPTGPPATPGPSMSAQRVELVDRDTVTWSRGASASVFPSPEAVAAVEAWLSGKVIFDSTPLRDAVVELDRYTPVKMRLGSSELGSTTVSGVFHIDRLADVDSLVFALENSLPILVERRGDELLLLASG
ncbi:MAG: FecR domain-containing protein [Acidobacteriota bacterium]